MFTKYVSHPKLQVLFAIFILLIIFGTGAFMLIEDWTLLDALYFTVSTITTVGFGDFVPTQPASKIIATIYMVLMVPTMLVVVGMIAEIVQERRGFLSMKKKD